VRTALDSNILSAIWSNEPSARAISKELSESLRIGTILLSPVAYAELLAHPRVTPSTLRLLLDKASVQIDFALTESVWTEAGLRYAQYAERRRRALGEFPKQLLPDFLVGSHALHQADRLMTFDIKRYRSYFPELILCDIDAEP
jgi:hypothetical protein